MNFIIPLEKLLEAINKELYGVIKEAILLSEHTINQNGQVIIEQKKGQNPVPFKVFNNMEDLNNWLGEFMESQSQWNIPGVNLE